MPEMPENRSAHRAREAFLEEMGQRLRAKMSPFEVDDTLREIRSHLDASAAAYAELGVDPAGAMHAAIAKFGDPQPIEEGLAVESRRSLRRPIWAFPVGIAAVLGAVLLPFADTLMVMFGVVAKPSPECAAIGLVLGAMIGLSLYRKPRQPLMAALRAGVLPPLCLFLVVFAINRLWPGWLYVGVLFGTFGFMSALTALITSVLVGLPSVRKLDGEAGASRS